MKVENLEKVFDAFGKKTVQTARGILNAKGKNTSGNLADSLGYHLKVYSSGALEMQFLAAGYAKFVDEGVSGTKKKYKTPYSYTNKQPPSGVIDKWVVRKGLKAARDSKGRFIKRKSLSFLIARSIKRKGIQGISFFQKPLMLGLKQFGKEMLGAVKDDIINGLTTVK